MSCLHCSWIIHHHEFDVPRRDLDRVLNDLVRKGWEIESYESTDHTDPITGEPFYEVYASRQECSCLPSPPS